MPNEQSTITETKVVQVQRNGRRRTRRVTGTARDIRVAKRQLESELERELSDRTAKTAPLERGGLPGETMTLNDFFATRWPSYASVHQNVHSRKLNENKIAYLLHHLGDKTLEDCLLSSTVDGFITAMKETGPLSFRSNRDGSPRKTRCNKLSDTTINKSLQLLKTALHVAYNDRLTSRPPRIKLIRQDDSKAVLPPSEHDFKTFLDSCEQCREWAPYLPEVVVFTAETGMRKTEVFTLTWKSVDWERGLIRVEEQPTFKLIDGSNWKPKNLRNREIPLSTRVKQILRMWMEKHPHGPDDVVVPSDLGSPYYTIYRADFETKGSGQGYFYEAVKYAGLQGKITFHGLRHLFAVRLLTAGAPVTVVSELLGHKNIEHTVKVYGRYSNDSKVRFETIRMLDTDAYGQLTYTP